MLVSTTAGPGRWLGRSGADKSGKPDSELRELKGEAPTMEDAPPRRPPLMSQVHADVARDMMEFAEKRRADLTPEDFACFSRWRSVACVQMATWGVVTSLVSYAGARLAKPRGPLSWTSHVLTVAGFFIGGASALPSTCPQLVNDCQRLQTPFGQSVRDSWVRHSTGGLGPPAQHAPKAQAAESGEALREPSFDSAAPDFARTPGDFGLDAPAATRGDALNRGPAGGSGVRTNQWGDVIVEDRALGGERAG